MKVLITGAAGNLGSHLAQYLLNCKENPELRLMVHNTSLPYSIEGFNNAELKELCNKVAMFGLQNNRHSISIKHFEAAIKLMRPNRPDLKNRQTPNAKLNRVLDHMLTRIDNGAA